MRNRIKGTLPLLAAAALLGNVAFAECPAFQAGNPMPTVVITDNDNTGAPDPSGEPNVFQYPSAFDLIDYIDLGSVTSNPDQDARWNFSEFIPGNSTPQSGGPPNQLYTINGNAGLGTVPTTAAGLQGSSYSAVSNGLLSFVNVKLSPPPIPVGGYAAPAPGDLGTGSQRTMTVFLIAPSTAVVACIADSAIDVASFSVITEQGGLDHLSPPLCFWTPFYDVADFGSTTTTGSVAPAAEWNFLRTNDINTAYVARALPTDAQAVAGGAFGDKHAAAGTTGVGMSGTTANTAGFASWGFTTDDLTQDRIYRTSVTVSSTKGAASTSAWWRARLGGSFFTYHGNAEEGFDHNAQSMPNSASGPTTMKMYMWVKTSTPASGFAAAGNIAGDAPFLIVDYIDFFNDGTAGSETDMVSDVVIESTTRDCFGTGTVLYNYGAAAISAVEDYSPPATGLAAFVVDGGATNFGAIKIIPGDTDVAFSAAAVGSGALNVSFATTGANDFGAGVVGSFNPAKMGFNADNTKLYAIDTWISPAITPNTTTSRPMILRLRFAANEAGNVHRNQFHTQWNLAPDTDFDGSTTSGGIPDNLSGLTTAGVSRHYASFWQPDLNTNTGTGGNTDTAYFVFVDFLWNRSASQDIKPQGTFQIERLLIQQYPEPTF